MTESNALNDLLDALAEGPLRSESAHAARMAAWERARPLLTGDDLTAGAERVARYLLDRDDPEGAEAALKFANQPDAALAERVAARLSAHRAEAAALAVRGPSETGEEPDAIRVLALPALGMLGLPVVAAVQALGHYCGRAGVVRYMLDGLGVESSAIGTLFTATAAWTLAGTLLAIPLALAMGPLPTASLGFGVAAVGWAWLATSSDLEGALVGLSLASGGAAFARPALFAGALRWFGQGWESARLGAAFAFYGAVNVGALFAPWLSDALTEALGASAAFTVGGVLSALAALLALGPFAASWALPMPSDRRSTQAFAVGPLLVAALTTLLAVQAIALWVTASEFQMQVIYAANAPPEWLFSLNPVVVAAACAVGALASVAAQAAGLRVWTHAVAGLGLVLLAAGLAPTFGLPAGSVPALMGVMALTAAGEALCLPALWASALGGVHFRLAILPAAALAATAWATGLAQRLAETFFGPGEPAAMATLLAGGIGFGGVVFLGLALPLRWASDQWGAFPVDRGDGLGG